MYFKELVNNMGNEKENQKRQNTIRFIEATQELIETDGLKNLSIRKIADKAGFHNSTIYLYFKDIEELILLASIKYFNEYSKNLSELSSWKLRPREHFLSVWDFSRRLFFRIPMSSIIFLRKTQRRPYRHYDAIL